MSTQERRISTDLALANVMRSARALFPIDQLTKTDYVLGALVLGICFLGFFHNDMKTITWASFGYLFGDPRDFYENAKLYVVDRRGMNVTAYPPSVYILFALWMYPFKLLGIIADPEKFSLYFVYWVKLLTSAAYIGSGVLFHKVALHYRSDTKWANYAALAWLTMPIALFVQFIFSQIDIFYVALTIAGFLMFLRDRLYAASVLFGVALTFKYFPIFVFIPLLLLYEKRLWRVAVCVAIAMVPLVLVNLVYGDSPVYLADVKGHWTINKIFGAAIAVDAWRIYLIFVAFFVLCGVIYMADVAKDARHRVAAYVWLASSVLPFMFIQWHTQWVMFCMPAIALTSLLSEHFKRYVLLDLAGMAAFLLATAVAYHIDGRMFRGDLIGIHVGDVMQLPVFSMGFDTREHAVGVFFSCFVAYLVLQLVLKYRPLLIKPPGAAIANIDYAPLRLRFHAGLLIFLVPAFYTLYRYLPPV